MKIIFEISPEEAKELFEPSYLKNYEELYKQYTAAWWKGIEIAQKNIWQKE